MIMSESTEENEERSETETEGFDKGDSDIVSQNENNQESRCNECQISFQNFDELKSHNNQKHPVLMYKSKVDDCLKWFSSNKARDKNSENYKSKLHKSNYVKSSSDTVFMEESSQEQPDLLKTYSNDYNRNKNKRGPKPKIMSNTNDKEFLVGLPRDQLKRKLMESVVEKIESIPNKKHVQLKDSSPLSLKYSKGSGNQTTQKTSKQVNLKGHANKNSDASNNFVPPVQKFKPIPDFSHIKVPILPIDISFSLEKFSEDLINVLDLYDPAGYFRYPLVDHFAPLASQLTSQIDMKTVQKKLKLGFYSKNLDSLQNDLLLLYSNGIHCFEEKSVGWNEACKLYQTALVNIQAALKKFIDFSENNINNYSRKLNVINNLKSTENEDKNNSHGHSGKISENERIINIGEQVGKLKSGTQNLPGYKEDRRNKVTVLSYLDYGANFSFGPSYDSGNAYCSKETSDLLIRAYGDINYSEEYNNYEELNEIIPEFILGDDFSLYMMNVFTRDTIKTYKLNEQVKDNKIPGNIDLSENVVELSSLQKLLNDGLKDPDQLKTVNYQISANQNIQPSINLQNSVIKSESAANSKIISTVVNCS